MTAEERRALLDRAITTYGAPVTQYGDLWILGDERLRAAVTPLVRGGRGCITFSCLIFSTLVYSASGFLAAVCRSSGGRCWVVCSHATVVTSFLWSFVCGLLLVVCRSSGGQVKMEGRHRHRVLCGDCTRPEDRALLLDGNKPEILLTDPPYCSGGSKESQKSTGSIGTERKNGKAPKIANDILSTRGYQNLIRGALTDIPCLYAYIFTDWRMWVYLFDLVEAAGFGVKSEIVWDKGTPGMGVGWRSQHELILFGAKAATHFDGHKGYGNVLSISRSGNELHPTQKPVELLEKLVDNTDFATGVYDPFGGSGTTLAACEAYGQPSYIMELTPAFTDVIVKRYIRITGKTTVRCVRQGRELPREEIAAIFEPDEEGGEQE